MKEYEIWAPAYGPDQGDEGFVTRADLLGKVRASSFLEACKIFCQGKEAFYKGGDDSFRCYAGTLCDNERDAWHEYYDQRERILSGKRPLGSKW